MVNGEWEEPRIRLVLHRRDLIAERMGFCTRAAEEDLREETCEIFCSHNTVANVLFCDGSVHALSNKSMFPKELEALMTIDGGELVQAGH